jgi:hypothetical protein|tara:strand:+ start:210 stop:422 length:213 start_codon:yes stop_codon:yes gene_type:complete
MFELDNYSKRIGGILVEDFNLSWKEAIEIIERFGHTDFFIELGSMDNNEVREEIQLDMDSLNYFREKIGG